MKQQSAQRHSIPLVNPVGAPESRRKNLAKRLDTLSGRTIGLLDNAKGGADLVMAEVKQYLEAKGAICSIYEFKPNLSNPLPQEYIDRLSKADAVVGGVGD